jgi:hypothetical protein
VVVKLLTGHHRSPHAVEEDSRWCCSGLQKHAMSWKRTVHLTSLVHSPSHPTSVGNCSERDNEQTAAFLNLVRLGGIVGEPRSVHYYCTDFMDQSSSLETNRFPFCQEILHICFIEADGSVLCSQSAVTGPCPQPCKSSTRRPIEA